MLGPQGTRPARRELGSCAGLTFEIHAGANYADFGLVQGLRETRRGRRAACRGAAVMGRQLAFYARAGAAQQTGVRVSSDRS